MSFIKHIFTRESIEEIKLGDIQRLIDNKIEEFLHLDYEEIPSKNVSYDGLSRHISGFLNTSGGIIIFGLSEQNKRFPHKFTWTNITKETLENNLFSKVQPWDKGIKIIPIKNPNDDTLRIFVINVPKSKNPPHMASHVYFIRLNFQTKPLDHEQVSGIFRQRYLLKSNLISNVYGPIYNELVTYYNQNRIKKWNIANLKSILRESNFLLSQDEEFAFQIDAFYSRIIKWNKALAIAPSRLRRIINSVATKFFKKGTYDRSDSSSVRMNIRAESTWQYPNIDRAILNEQDPLTFWKEENEFAKILEASVEVEIKDTDGKKDYNILHVNEEKYKRFLEDLKKVTAKDELIQYIRKEYIDMKGLIETYFFEELQSRMH
jgi:hypothetical protein